MSIWLIIAGLLFFVALAVEGFNAVAPDMFAAAVREAEIKEEISELHHDLGMADKKLESSKASADSNAAEVEKLRQESIRLERELNQRKDVPPVLVYRIAPPSPTLLRYRASVTKPLPEDADAQQKLVWRSPAVVETWAISPQQAKEQASHHFRRDLGYAVAAFVRRDET